MRLAPALAAACLSAGILAATPASAICIGDGEYELALADMYMRDAARLKQAKARARGQTLMPPPSPPQTVITRWPDFSEPEKAEVAHLGAHEGRTH
jgi:hypothetical protein